MQSGVRTEISDISIDRRVRATAIRTWVDQKDRHGEGSARPTTKNPTVHRIRTDPTRECGWEGGGRTVERQIAWGLTTGNRVVSFPGSPPAARLE
jgi:hypothetical protein